MTDAKDALDRLFSLWEQERAYSRAQAKALRQQTPLKERIALGIALDQLSVTEIEAAPGDRTRQWIESQRTKDLTELKLRPGEPVILWRNSPDEPDAVRAIVDKLTPNKLAVIIDGEPPEQLDADGFRLDVDDPEVTFKRGAKALRQWMNAKPHEPAGKLGALLFGQAQAATISPAKLDVTPDHLNATQQQAVALAIGAPQLALIHGPPGTGKTTTLVEVIERAVRQEHQRVLATAASNMAVDNLAARLHERGLKVVRLGHPARVHDEAIDLTLDAQLQAHDTYKLTRGWLKQANDLFRRLRSARDNNTMSWDQRRELRREANGLMRDVRQHTRAAQDAILERAQVILATATGADSRILSAQSFDLVVVDEATQCPDPLLLIPLSLAPKVILAGDPHQLAPTILDPKAEREGLGSTCFDRLIHARPQLGTMLTVQHRMHTDIMTFPSISKYDGKLEAHPSVASRRLEALGVMEDPLRDAPLIFIDTAGKGWDEERVSEDSSTYNAQQAERTAAEARRLLSRGLDPNELAIITPYDAQAKLLRQLLAPERALGVEIATIDSFQGREKEATIVDLVRSNDRQELGFLTDTRRLNVALTRAKRQLIVIADSATISAHPYYASFLDAAQIYGLWISAWNDDAEPLS